MDDTAEITARLGRIEALAARSAGHSELLSEVRRLLEEGERSFARTADELAGAATPWRRETETCRATGAGEEAAVS